MARAMAACRSNPVYVTIPNAAANCSNTSSSTATTIITASARSPDRIRRLRLHGPSRHHHITLGTGARPRITHFRVGIRTPFDCATASPHVHPR
nr:hypothetical protein GCM10017611_05550 [Rhodococcus wratislaviensis]